MSLNSIDCFLTLGNPNLHLSRRDCSTIHNTVKQNNIKNIVYVINDSVEAGNEAWPG
jgi:hypothetical protein